MRLVRPQGRRRASHEGAIVTLESFIAGLIAVVILVYLVYTLLRPEKF